MTREEFTRALEQNLRSRGDSFDLGRLLVYVEACWPLILGNPDVNYWADRFIEARRLLTGE